MGCNLTKDVAPQVVEDHAKDLTLQAQEDFSAKDAILHQKLKSIQTKTGEGEEDQAEVEGAVTKIQAVFRGHRVRKQMASGDPTKEQLEAEFSADDKDMVNAATKIQATFRGHMSRKKDDDTPKAEEEEEELDIDLTDPELNKAATKIQASFRGHKVRKDEPKPQ